VRRRDVAAVPTPDRAPLAVLVGGAPGSGKTTLADVLAPALDVPVLHNDGLCHGIWRTRNRAMELGPASVEPFYRSMELWLEAGISFVAERTFFPGISEPDVTSRLAPRASLVHVHCRSTQSTQRWEDRMRRDPLCGEKRLAKLLPLVTHLNQGLREPLDFGCPVLVVDTDDGYRPALEELVAAIDLIYSRPRAHDLDRDT
jgi:Zeta toxin